MTQPRQVAEVVYYWRRGDLVKIGTTRSFSRRYHQLLPGELLAVEPGSYLLERARHAQFAALRAADAPGREWFQASPQLMKHVEGMASLYPVDEFVVLPKPRVPPPQREWPSAFPRKQIEPILWLIGKRWEDCVAEEPEAS